MKVVRINVDTMRNVAEKYEIMAVPTLLFFKDGKPLKRIIGYASQAEISKFEQEHQRKPSVTELSQITKMEETKIDQTIKADNHHMSIDAPFGSDDDDNAMVDVMASGDDSRTDKGVDFESMASELQRVLKTVLKERERKILCYCYGIGCHEKGLEEIGSEFNLTRERVRQIREKSIIKLRDSGKIKILMKYLG